MSKDSNPAPENPKRINLSRVADLAYWTAELECTATELRLAVREVGPIPRAVREHLRKGNGVGEV